ncbi:uncharacterized protein LOC120448200 isoform X1 [Drosophila santomea]|uniref:uncharacterized protein LOC120448200 isoform X1 n=1 Tax=Drosophila santomea TaxID=129105 RepID=UPI001954B7FB|nr:uncharacterized protein LOC120448200 isoform X1 [Drosophila santomea]
MYQMCRLLFILIFAGGIARAISLEVNFQETYPTHFLNSDQTSLHKRAADAPQFFDQASFSFDGLTRVASVPVPFPLDICVLQLPTVKYATALHKNTAGLRHFAVYIWRPAEQDFQLLVELETPRAVALDCLAFAGRGYVAVSYNLTEPVSQAREGSPIYEISPETGIRTVQYFSGTHLRGMYLRISSQELTLLHAFESGAQCPYFKWMGKSFQKLGAIRCSNARRMEAFGIEFTDYVAVANYADSEGRTATHSEIFRWDAKSQRFQLFQRLRSNGAVDVKYFSLPVNEVSRRHFLILGNTFGGTGAEVGEADTVIYVFEKGQFVPYQRLSFYALERVLPVQHSISEKFLLLVACSKQDVKIYNLNDWRFEKSKVQFTEGALSRGVARMRSYEEKDHSFLVIANENMAANETNIFQPLYKQDEHANILRQQIIDWAREQRKRLEQVNVEHLLKRLEDKLKHREENLKLSVIKLVNAKSFEDKHMKLTPNYWKALKLTKQALDKIEQKAISAGSRHPNKRSVGQPNEELNFDEVTVDTLVVHGTVKADHINGVDTRNPVYDSVTANNVYVSAKYTEPAGKQRKPLLEELKVKDLQLGGRLNGLKWTELFDLTLKRSNKDVQFIKATVDLDHLKSDAVQVNSNEINDRPLGQLIPVDSGDFIVQHDVQFSQPIQVNRLLINQRLNHIHVDRQRFDVLTKQANHTQVIEGAVRFENVRVMEPITIAGQIMGAELRAMSPAKVTHKSLQLNGDFVIDGDVTIGRLLQMKDFVDESTQKSAAEALSRSMRLDEPLEDVSLNFVEPLIANNTELSFLNTRDLQHLVKLNVGEVQLVEASKIFPQNVEIVDGFGEIKWLNGIDTESLPEVLLSKSGNQTILSTIQLQGVETNQVTSSHMLLNVLGVEDYLQAGQDQKSNGTLYIDSLDVWKMSVDDLHLNGHLLGQTLSSIYEHGSKSLDSWHLPPNFKGTLHAQNLWLSDSINKVKVIQLEQQLQQLAGNIKYVGDFTFEHDVNISSLTFQNSLNGIEAYKFGSCWLENEGDQNFTAPQELASVDSQRGLWLKGQLNNHSLEDLENRSYRLSAPEHLQSMRFANPIVLQSELKLGHLNLLRVPEDVIYHNGGGYISTPVSIRGNLEAAELSNITSLNGYPLEALELYLTKRNVQTFVAENVRFGGEPSYHLLNGHTLGNLLDQVWLDNEQIDLGEIRLESGQFEGLLEFQGPINGHQVEYIRRNYFSRTRSNLLKTPLSFQHDVTFTQPPVAEYVKLRRGGSDVLMESSSSNFSLDFDDFVAHSLKTAGSHSISGKWELTEGLVLGNLNHVKINNLNLANDVLRIPHYNDSGNSPMIIDALKTVQSSIINRLHTTAESQVAEVPVTKWINEAAYLYLNHSIAGTTRLNNVNLYNDLTVKGPVNGVLWQTDTLILMDKEQDVPGSLLVANSFPEQQRVMSNNVKNLWVDFVNDLPVNEFLVSKAENRPNLHVESQLIFTQPLTVGHYDSGNGNGFLDNYYKKKRGVKTNDIQDWQQLQENVAAIKKRLTKPPKVLEGFSVLQQLSHKASHMKIISLDNDDVLAIWEHTWNKVVSYTWQPDKHLFGENSSLFTPTELKNTNLDQSAEDSQTPKKLHFRSYGFQCRALQEENQVVIRCLDKQNKSRKAILPRRAVKQLLAVADSYEMPILVSSPRAVELWKWTSGDYSLSSRLMDGQVEQMELSQGGAGMESGYVALMASSPAAEIRIYSFDSTDTSSFHLDQVLELQDAQQSRVMRFMHLPESNDLLLCVSNVLPQQPLSIYQHRGAAGFQQILGDSALPKGHALEVLQLPRHKLRLLSMATQEAVYLLQPQFTTL